MLGKAKRVVVSFGLGQRPFCLVLDGSDWEGRHQQAEGAATVDPWLDERVLYNETVELLSRFRDLFYVSRAPSAVESRRLFARPFHACMRIEHSRAIPQRTSP